jgi:hypothetical protein
MKTRELEEGVYSFAKYHKRYWALIPRFMYAGLFEADFIAFGKGKGITEIELKVSWSNYKSDYTKHTWDGRAEKRPGDNFNNKYYERELSRLKRIHGKDYEFPHNKVSVKALSKYEWLLGTYDCSWRPNIFIYAAPMKLAERIATDSQRKKPFGVWGVDEDRVRVLVHPKRLLKLRPWYMGNFRSDVFRRSINCMDSYFKFDPPKLKN